MIPVTSYKTDKFVNEKKKKKTGVPAPFLRETNKRINYGVGITRKCSKERDYSSDARPLPIPLSACIYWRKALHLAGLGTTVFK